MSNAAIFFAGDAFDTSARLMGRQSAGESFLRGFIRHADVDRFYFWNWSNAPLDKAQALVERIQLTDKPATWYARHEFGRIADPGCLFVSSPANPTEAWNRRLIGPTRYSVCGLTHTTASAGVMDALINLILAPVEPWDALICTSRAVQRSVEAQLGMAIEYLRERLGPVKAPPLRLATIPLGINAADFERSETDRRRWRDQLGVAEGDIVVLYVGRFSAHAKMNPVPMAMALERAARRSQRRIHWVQVGWADAPVLQDTFTTNAARCCPSVTCHVLDGRLPEVRFPIWSAGDVFLSLSDNIQETFGLTPVEAMAAGLPSVVSDWDGYRDTIRHEIDGFRVPTVAPRPGMGGDLAVAHGNAWESYDVYVGKASQFAAVDIDAAAEALLLLFENDELRRRMGAAAQAQARAVFDWRHVIPEYQALWKELEGVRLAAPAKPAAGLSPWRPDPFTLFSSYPSQHLPRDAKVSLSKGASAADVLAIWSDPSVRYAQSALAQLAELQAVVRLLEGQGEMASADIVAAFAPGRSGAVERSLLWLAKFGLVSLSPRANVKSG